MKKIFIIILFLMCTNIKALEITYSDWSEEYPKGVNDILIQKEDRYKWYKKKETNINYLIKEDIKDKNVDYNDYKIITNEEIITEPTKYEDRIITSSNVRYTFKETDVTNIMIRNFYFNDPVKISEVIVTNIKTNEKINYTLDNDLNKLYHYNFINDGNLNEYIRVNNPTILILNLDSSYNAKDLNIKIYYKCEGININYFELFFATKRLYGLYYNRTHLNKCISNECIINIDYKSMKEQLTFNDIVLYTYKDKLYKTYDIEKEYSDGYYKYLDEYTKDETDFKTFYRYITNEYIVVDINNNIVTNEDYCIKEICLLMYINKPNEEEKIIEMPKTIDNINYYLYALILSITLLIIIFVLIKKKKIFCRTKKISSFVEKI